MLNCVDWMTWFFSAAGIVVLLEWLKRFPKIGPIVEANGTVMSGLITVFAPMVLKAVLPVCNMIDTNLWFGGSFIMLFILSQLEYRFAKRVGVV